VQVLEFVSSNALLLILPIGIVLRSLFATRRAGGFLIALAIGLYVLYPSFIMIFPNPESDLVNASAQLDNFTNNSIYATMPVVDLNDNYAIAGKLDLMSGRCANNLSNSSLCQNYTAAYLSGSNSSEVPAPDFTGDLTVITQANSDSISKVLLYSVVAPILSLILTIIFVRELGEVLGSEVGLSTFSSI
jgi:hypothetical protein